ncbi:hypothetical protein JQN58_16520 [Aneurinibacillus sp. BA2021]|nr:hypothetical protein [Aneurinibacillus sp. BA2021]
MNGLLLLLAAGWLGAYIGMAGVRRWFPVRGWIAPNYTGKEIPLGYGCVFAFCLLFFLFEGIRVRYDAAVLLMTGGAIVASLIGWIDDRIGQQETKGLRGHMRQLWNEGRISTGLWKAAVIGGCAFLLALRTSTTFGSLVAHTLLLMLGANFINLLDVRPGRALKGFWLIQLLCIGFGVAAAEIIPLFLYVFICTLAAAPADFSGKAMLGDTGANLLGFAAGMFCMYSFGPQGEWLLVLLLSALHLYTEKVSLTAVIERHPLLYRIDGWGRTKQAKDQQ